MAKYEQKTKASTGSVAEFIAAIADGRKRADAEVLCALMSEVTGEPPRLWGTMVGFGEFHYKYATGHEGDTFLTGFAPRKANLTLYITSGFHGFEETLQRLGKHRSSVSCLYINRLSNIDRDVLREIIAASVARQRALADSGEKDGSPGT